MKLFVYGTLGPPYDPAPRGWSLDAVRGLLYDLGRYPALVRWDDPRAPWVEGAIRDVDLNELRTRLDPYEAVDDGLFSRVETTTRAGVRVWVYVYARPLPQWAKGPIERWDPRTEGRLDVSTPPP